MQQQRQPRLGDILDDYCPRERRVTNHVVVAMVESEVKQTRCSTCDAEHAFKHAKVPRQRRRSETPAALYSQVLAGGPKRVAHDPPPQQENEASEPPPITADPPPAEPEHSEREIAAVAAPQPAEAETPFEPDSVEVDEREHDVEQGPAHRRLIRATLPRVQGQPPPTRPAPEFTIRQPNSRPGRFRPRQPRGPSSFLTGHNGNRSGNMGGGAPRGGGRPPVMSRTDRRHGPGGGHKRSK